MKIACRSSQRVGVVTGLVFLASSAVAPFLFIVRLAGLSWANFASSRLASISSRFVLMTGRTLNEADTIALIAGLRELCAKLARQCPSANLSIQDRAVGPDRRSRFVGRSRNQKIIRDCDQPNERPSNSTQRNTGCCGTEYASLSAMTHHDVKRKRLLQ